MEHYIRRKSVAFTLSALSALVIAGCSGTVGPFIGVPSSTSPVVLTASSISFTGAGTSNAQNVTASQQGYSSNFVASTPNAGQTNSCSGVATISPSSGTSFTVTPVAAGACTFTLTGGSGQSATMKIDVTLTNVGGS
jgi:hypothetical protein